MNALDILKRDHQTVKGLFQEATRTSDLKARRDVFNKIDAELETHAHLEETIFYPALEEHEELADIVAEAREEHQQVKVLLEEIEEAGAESHDFGAKLQELIENVEHHVKEEEGEMFSKVQDVFDEQELEQLGRQLESAKGVKQHRQAV